MPAWPVLIIVSFNTISVACLPIFFETEQEDKKNMAQQRINGHSLADAICKLMLVFLFIDNL